jgi:5-methyltetrahydrofolate--homocysteine methyltransferase
MTSRFLDVLRSGRVLLMDGAMGTELRRAGLPPGECGEAWNLSHPERVRATHQAYVDVGAECLLTNTFQSNPAALARHGLQEQIEAINAAAVTLAGAVAGPDRFVLVDIGPMMNPDAPAELSNPRAIEQVVPELRTIDAVLLETFSDPLALFTARHCRVVSWLEAVPILLSLTYRRDESGKLSTQSRHPPEWFAMQAQQYGVAGLGVNCGRDIGMDEVIEIIRRYRRVTDLPLFARPNAGTPTRDGDGWRYPQTPELMAARLPELLEAGVSMVGGCCGTTPDHIRAFRPIIDRWNERR